MSRCSTSGCKNLITECLKYNSNERCDLEYIWHHPWLSEGDTSLPLPISGLNSSRYKLGSVPAKLVTHAEQHPALRYAIANAGGSDSHLSAFMYMSSQNGSAIIGAKMSSISNRQHSPAYRSLVNSYHGNLSISSSCSSGCPHHVPSNALRPGFILVPYEGCGSISGAGRYVEKLWVYCGSPRRCLAEVQRKGAHLTANNSGDKIILILHY
ncbi:unnamed protein product [Acanthocheilonema viteae]|uniref:Uncharacterized protein n=1 Tax=Acanthocheilonema viteae TaxID=6277 RepID=A0A498SZU4_ACAVI|nr:unnamed protein product [Acanthocheilonema viteae]